MQGQTIKQGSKTVVDWNNKLPPALGYMMLSRSESIQDLFIAGKFDSNKIRCDPKALEEAKRLEDISLTKKETKALSSNQLIGFCFLNIRSLNSNFEHLEIDSVLLNKKLSL